MEHAGGDHCRGAAAGAARRVLGIPGIARGAEDLVFRDGKRPELGRVGAAHDQEAGFFELAHGVRVEAPDLGLGRERAVRDRMPRRLGKILDRNRHAEERRQLFASHHLRFRRLRFGEQLVVAAPHQRVEPGIPAVADRQKFPGHFYRTHGFSADRVGEL
jgi:hypothetical protein